MNAIVNLYSNSHNEIKKFLSRYYENNNIYLNNDLKWEKTFENPIEISDIIGVFIENNEDYNINMWISIDKGVFINITNDNADQVIRYLFERYPY